MWKANVFLLACCTSMVAATAPLCLRAEEYRGKFTPDAEYVLSGQLDRDLPPLPEVPFRLLGAEDGFRAERISEVPSVGVHPRVVLSPSDLEEIRANIARGDQADRIFRVVMRDLRNKAALSKPARENFGNAPWAGIGVIAAKALLASLTNDQALGREAAEWTVRHALYLEPMIELLNAHPDAQSFKDNFYFFSRTGVSVGGVGYEDAYRRGGSDLVRKLAVKDVKFHGQDNQWVFTSLGAEYDYAYNFMTEEERALVRRVIAAATAGKYTTGMEIPGHFFINNHMSMGAEFYTLILAIEGEEGYDPRIEKQYLPRLMDKMTYDISPDGILYENVKGFIPLYPIYAAGRRGDRTHLRHNHLPAMFKAKLHATQSIHNRYFGRGRSRPGVPIPDVGEGPQDPRFWIVGADSGPGGHAAFVWGWVMKRLYPDDAAMDFAYKISLQTTNFDLYDGSDDETSYNGKIHYNCRSMTDLMLLCATDGARDDHGDAVDYQKAGVPDQVRQLPKAWCDLNRGIARARSGWDVDDLVVDYECRSDMFYGGHETPEQGDFELSSHGILWSPYTGAYMDSYFRNMVLVDGYAGVYQPTPGKLLAVYDTPAAATFVSDATDAYSWKKQEKNFYLWHHMLDENPVHTDWLRHIGFRINRNWELPFQPHMRAFYDGFAHLDWGPWHGETRGPEYYERWQTMDHVFRTFHLARGKRPYVLIVDDLRKDDGPHQFDWNLIVNGDVQLYQANSVAKNRHLTKGTEGAIGTDLLLCLADSDRKRNHAPVFGGSLPDVRPAPKSGDPMLLVRVLWRNTSFPYPLPSFEQAWKCNRVKVPAYAVEPEYRILLYPHRFGDPLPLTKWSDDRRILTVAFDGQVDTYAFDETDRGRTVFAMERGGEIVARTEAAPPAPLFINTAGWTPDHNLTKKVRMNLFAESSTVAFQPAPGGAEIRYTLNGSHPTHESTLYTGPFSLTHSATVKACTFHDAWPCGEAASAVAEARYEKRLPEAGAAKTADLVGGLRCDVFELRHTIFDERGFFTDTKNMLPDLNGAHAIASVAVGGFTVPTIKPTSPPREMEKGYYRFQGMLNVSQDGVYSFRVDSCGPVVLTVGKQTALSVTGPYGLSQKARYGQAVLAAGLHRIELTVCDPVFWKGDMEQPMALNVTFMEPCSHTCAAFPTDALWRPAEQTLASAGVDQVPTGTPVEKHIDVVPGLVESRYDWYTKLSTDLRADAGHFRSSYSIPTDGLPSFFLDGSGTATPYAREVVRCVSGNPTLKRLLAYRGFFKARQTGTYTWRLDPAGANRLMIGGVEVVRNRIQGRKAAGAVHLDAGLYDLELLIAKGNGTLEVGRPGDLAFAPAVMGDLLRAADAETITRGDCLVAALDFETLNNERTLVSGNERAKATVEGGRLVDGRQGQALQITGARGKLVLSDISLPDDACTIAFHVRRGKHGDSFPIRAEPSKFQVRFRSRDAIWAGYFRSPDEVHTLGGQAMAEKQWFHFAVTYGDFVKVYVDGKLIDSRMVDRSAFHSPATDARAESITFMDGEDGGIIDSLRVWNRILSAEEIAAMSSHN